VDSASAWAKYLTDTAGLSAFVARPSDAPPPISAAPPQMPTTPQAPSQAPSASAPPQPTAAPQQTAARTSSRYNPQPLGAGFAVLVDFFSRPELAGQIQQILGKDVGLVSYGQRPYLLAIYTGDQTTANSILQTLTDRGFWTMVVDSRRVTLLRPAVSLTGSIVQN
ncbi:hypothetical protein H6F43_02465, partial [Leptolyngbya sp. FACHB-36]|nr:hypothetical protein [Leptolyngbya sp. FACHB-36]